MKVVKKTYKFRLYPDKEQKILLSKHFGCCRFVYNHFLNRRKESYLNENISLNYYDCQKELTLLKKVEGYSWLREVNSQSIQYALRNLDVAYNRFFTKLGKFPRFKKKGHGGSFTVPQNVRLENQKLYIPKFREGIPVNLHRELQGEILMATVTMNPAGQYFVSVVCDTTIETFPLTGKSVGIDTGIKDLAILSDGYTYGNPKYLKENIKKVKHLQGQLSKKEKGSNEWKKTRLKLARAHQKVTDCRLDYLHKVTTEIVKNHDVIVVEDLAVKNMMKNHHLAQAFSDVALGTFYSLLEYKCEWHGRAFVKVDRFFPSSKTCSVCGHVNQDLQLKDRFWTCPACETLLDRDHNAAKNILTQGLNLLSGSGTDSEPKQKRVEALPLGESVKPEATHFQ